ncbi:hypothetical protein LG293_17220 (plasmid) [Citricoccus nitrophenolicus]
MTSRNRVTKGVATGGQFAKEQAGEAAGGTSVLTARTPKAAPERRPDHEVLDTALERYGLTVDDAPGLAEAWEDRYGSHTEIESVDDVFNDALGGIDYGRHRGGPWLVVLDTAGMSTSMEACTEGDRDVIIDVADFDPRAGEMLAFQVHTRNGGGNRECWNASDDECEGCTGCTMDALQEHPLHLGDMDNSFDSTYADIFFSVPAGHTERALTAHRNATAVQDQQTQSVELKAIEAGTVPPWHLLRGDAKQVSTAAQELRRARNRREAAAESVSAARLRYAYLDGTAEPASGYHRGSFATEDELRAAREAKISGTTGLWGASDHDIRDDHLAKIHHGLSSAQAKAQKWDDMEAQALALPDGDLKSWLLDDLPERTYETTEGTGRKKKKVLRTYTPKGELASHVADTQRVLGDRQAEYNKSKTLLDFLHAGRADRAQEAMAGVTEAENVYEQSWRAGFTGDPEKCPAAPEVK